VIVASLINVFADSAEVKTAADDASAAALAGARILLVEDNEINQQIAVELLEGAGATVEVADNGREAVAILSATPNRFNVVLMDLQMPEMDGYQATARLRSDPRFSALPIIAMTAHATVDERQRCLAAGMNDHVAKPIDPARLFETVRRYYSPADVAARAAVSKQTDLRAADDLPSIADLDTKDGLSRVLGNRTLYMKLLRQFVDQQSSAVEQIDGALTSGDTELAARLAHTLKGVAGNIGAGRVQSAAGALEKSIRDAPAGPNIDSARQQLASSLDPLIAELRSLLDRIDSELPVPLASTASANPDQSREAAARLLLLLAESDPDAAGFVEANRAALQPLFVGAAWPEFEVLVQDYAFSDAQARLEQAMKCIPPAEQVTEC
jgi:two-component system, sensor histidine kinase and response regulator